MPELPEVETVVRTLQNLISGKTIAGIDILYPNIISGDPDDFQRLVGQSFIGFKRRGKYLLFEMDDCLLVSHLRMEGKYFYYPRKTVPNKHTHVIFAFTDGSELHYNDVRKFGRMELVEKDIDLSDFHGLGVEPFSAEFNFDHCKGFLKDNHKTIKEILLEQKLVAGAGNIYADEICYAIKVHPAVSGNKLDDYEIKALIKETNRILSEAIEAGGTTIRSYTSSLGVTGRFQLSLKCHTMDKCQACGSDIIKTRIGGRGTYYCPRCQAMKNRKIAITGTIGSGKSTLSNYLREKGYYVFDCDLCNAQLLEKGKAGYRGVKKAFPDCFDANGLDKTKLSAIVFNDKKSRAILESILHPLIIAEMMNEAYGHELFFAEVPLLFENGLQDLFDESIVVAVDEDIAIRRLIDRDLDEKSAKERIANQLSVKDKLQKCNHAIFNNKDKNAFYTEIDELLERII